LRERSRTICVQLHDANDLVVRRSAVDRQLAGYYRYRSKDGKKWERTGEFVNEPMKGDLCFFYRAPNEGYAAYYRLGSPRRPTDLVPVYEDFPQRSCYRAVSRDGNKWVKDPIMLLTADELAVSSLRDSCRSG
jgi:hypothetical protein